MITQGHGDNGEKPRMLVVDDEVENTELLRRMFRQEFAVEIAQSGNEALEILASSRFDVIITDQMMPGMTGVELLHRSLVLAPDAVRILVTGFPNLEAAIASVNEGRAHRFFTKPLDRHELRDVVAEALGSQSATRQLRTRVQRLERENRGLRGRVGDDVDMSDAELAANAEPARAGLAIDEATGLLTREGLVERLEEEVARSERFGLLCSLILIRSEEYRVIWDRSEEEGQRLLERMTWLIRLRSRRYDIGARWSEDTLGLLLPHVGVRGSEARVARILQASAGSDEDPALQLNVAVASFPETHETVQELVSFVESEVGLS